jgi:hypothetical protein
LLPLFPATRKADASPFRVASPIPQQPGRFCKIPSRAALDHLPGCSARTRGIIPQARAPALSNPEGATAATRARDLGLTTLTVALEAAGEVTPVGTIAEGVAEGAMLGLYRFHELKTKLADERPDLERLVVLAPEAAGSARR